MPVYQAGSLNVAALQAPDLYVIIQPPSTAYINGVPTDGLGLVGVGSWGPVNAVMLGIGTLAQAQQAIGPVTNRSHDLATAVAVGTQNNAQNFGLVRVTDGTDTAASVALKDIAGSPATGMTLTASYTGIVGNSITAGITAGTAPNTYKLSIQRQSFTPEVYDNIGSGVSGATITAGTGYTSVPSAAVSPPQSAGTQATGQVSMKVVSANITGSGANAGSGYVTGDTITLANGVVLTATATAGAITALSVTNGGSVTGGALPTSNNTQVSTSGAGIGAIINLVWGIGNFIIGTSGFGYSSATATLTGGGGGTGGAITLICTPWLNFVNAVNAGQNGIRGPSQIAVATIGVSSTTPNVSTTYTMAGGTDGAAGVTDNTLVGTDGLTRTGMYALRKSGVQVGNLVDCQTPSTWTAQLAFGLQEGIYFHTANPPGTSVQSSATNLSTAGIDGYAMNCLVGDWTYWQDNANGVQRMLSPATFTSALQAATSPEQSVLNKPVGGVIATQRSLQNLPYSDSEIGLVATSRLEVLTLGAPGGSYFACRTGRNISSNAATNGDNYTRMTNFVAYTIAAAYGKVIGKPQTVDLRRATKASMDAFFSNLQREGMIGNVNAPTQPGWSVVIDASNNPFSQVAQGYMQANVAVTYLSIVRYFLVNIQGGQTVSVTPVQ